MLKGLTRYFVGKYSRNERYIRQLNPLVQKINSLEQVYSELSDEQLQNKTVEFKERLTKSDTLDSLLPEAFAVVREASKRVLGMRHFDVQLKGGIVLHRGMIAEMKTGEGKTLVATLPVYLNALTEKGVHVITVNDYLAQRDSAEMGRIYRFLGLSVGCIVQDLSSTQRRAAYHSDITYGTNNEFGFDYLRDNMRFRVEDMCQRPFAYAIVDEVDSILIDEARTPLIISGPAEDSSDLYAKVDAMILKLRDVDYEKEEKTKSISFTDTGYEHVEQLVKEFNLMKGEELFRPQNLMLVHHLNQALKAQKMFHRDIDYIIKDGQVIIIDEFTGRMMKGRRYSDGLHQALEAKEKVEIEPENQTVASITFQNYFRMYPKLSGMTGTAQTEAAEFDTIYKLQVIAIPTNVTMIRKDIDDEIFRTFEHKKIAIIKQIKECYERKQPVLVGTVSIEKSEILSVALTAAKIPHSVLNARQHEKEAGIIAEAGAPGAVTIATNMAGRGTDIKMGGNVEMHLAAMLEGVELLEERQKIEKEVREKIEQMAQISKEAGGLFVLGTERNESRRIDNQLRGRSGRQGDPGASKFFISLEDDLMRIFGPNIKLMEYSLRQNENKENEPIAHPWLTRAIEKAQQRVEAQHFDTRKHLLKYSEVLNSQRKAVYDERFFLMGAEDVHHRIQVVISETVHTLIALFADENNSVARWDINHFKESCERIFNVLPPIDEWVQDGISSSLCRHKLEEMVIFSFLEKENAIGVEGMRMLEKTTLLRTLDSVWIAHLNAMEHLRQGIYLQAYGQKDPLNEYKHEAFIMFKAMITDWHQSSLSFISHFVSQQNYFPEDDSWSNLDALSYQHPSTTDEDVEDKDLAKALLDFISHRDLSNTKKINTKVVESEKFEPPNFRNEPCPCGSGKRYKHCHGHIKS